MQCYSDRSEKGIKLMNMTRTRYKVFDYTDEPEIQTALKYYTHRCKGPYLFISNIFCGSTDMMHELMRQNRLKSLIQQSRPEQYSRESYKDDDDYYEEFYDEDEGFFNSNEIITRTLQSEV